MVVVKLYGGLGNQMFQYAMGKAVAEARKCELYYEGEYFRNSEKFGSSWTYQLDLLKTNIKEWKPSYLNLFNLFARALNKFNINLPGFYFEKNHTYRPEIHSTSAQFFFGYFQSELNFNKIRPILLQEFESRTKASEQNQVLIQKMQSCEAVALHVRRGDYLTQASTQVHGTCNLDYYRKCIAHISQKVSNPVFFIFSDDQAWTKENLKIDFECHFIDHNKGEQSYWDMLLMKNCKHNITANSSFSWWGAWLNTNPNKIVMAPAKWYNDTSINTENLHPKDWIKVQ
ncbi:alpha-1,2-fucosyltransferase [Bdellovibrio sp. qaytius]|nr:alpha-1,2-fucosyltransferase [Bdellovibrio sp. qaytius]